MTQCRRILHPSRCVFLSSSHATMLPGSSPALKLTAFRASSCLFRGVCSSGQGQGGLWALLRCRNPALLSVITLISGRWPLLRLGCARFAHPSWQTVPRHGSLSPNSCVKSAQRGTRAWMRLIRWEGGQSLSRTDAKRLLSVLPQPAQMASIGTRLCRKATIQGGCEKGSSASPCQSRGHMRSCFHLFVEGGFEGGRVAHIKIPY